MPTYRWKNLILVLALTGFVTHPPVAAAQAKARAAVTMSDLSNSLEATAQMVGPAVVEIFTRPDTTR